MRQCSSCGGFCKKSGCELENYKPPQSTWVGLTRDEIGDLSDFAYNNDEEFIRNVEAKLKEKNA